LRGGNANQRTVAGGKAAILMPWNARSSAAGLYYHVPQGCDRCCSHANQQNNLAAVLICQTLAKNGTTANRKTTHYKPICCFVAPTSSM